MKHVKGWIFAASAFLCCMTARAQGGFELEDGNTATPVTFTNSLGTAELVGSMIVFEGQLDADVTVTAAASGPDNHELASLQLLTQMKLFDELPDASEVGTAAQGAIAALRDAPESTTGILYAWGTVGDEMGWVQLFQPDGETPFTVTDGSNYYITFVFNYTTDSYQVFVGPTAASQVASVTVPSMTMEGKNGIAGVSLLGTGGLEAFASASGDPSPLSSSIGFSVYATANGILFILDPVGEQGSGWFTVFARINGEWVEVGKIQSDGSGHYEFLAYPGLLQIGQSYAFKVIDEIGNPHELADPVAIQSVKMESVVMKPDVMLVTFNTEPGKSYQVISAASLTSPTWTATAIYFPTAVGEGYGSEPFTAGGTSTTVRIPRNTEKAFFKIRKVN